MELELEMAKVNSCLPYLSSLSIYFISPQIDKKKKKRKKEKFTVCYIYCNTSKLFRFFPPPILLNPPG